VVRKSRLIVALGLVLALGVSGVAFGGGADAITTFVDGKVKPSKKLEKKKFKKASLFLGVRNEANITGTQSNPASEYISISKNVKVDLSKAETCPVTFGNGTPTDAAKAQCPPGSVIGEGTAEVQGPGNTVIAQPVVTVFNGPGPGQLQLHTYSDDLGAASPTVPGSIEKSRLGGKFGNALNVPAAPETGALMITSFNATLDKSSGVAKVKCKPKTVSYQRDTVFKDGTTETSELTQKVKCKKKKKK
jgi:hypothetical protein